jgi:hypothetical protein
VALPLGALLFPTPAFCFMQNITKRWWSRSALYLPPPRAVSLLLLLSRSTTFVPRSLWTTGGLVFFLTPDLGGGSHRTSLIHMQWLIIVLVTLLQRRW